MSEQHGEVKVDPYILRLLDECRAEIQLSDSKASILFAGVATVAALLANNLISDKSALRTSGAGAVTLALIAAAAFGVSIAMLGLAVAPRVGHPEAGKARYFEEHALFATPEALLATIAEDARVPAERHAQQLLTLSRIAHRKYRYLRHALYAVCAGIAFLALAGLASAV
jgi:Family of unknown function (DUF5706)